MSQRMRPLDRFCYASLGHSQPRWKVVPIDLETARCFPGLAAPRHGSPESMGYYMQDDSKDIQRQASPQTVPLWSRSDPEEALAIQLAVPKCGDFLTTNEQDDELSVEWRTDEQEPLQEDAFEFGPIDSGDMNKRLGDPPRSASPFFPCRTPEITDAPLRLPATVPASSGPTWTISAPQIERAITTLLGRLNRTPTDAEIAEELNFSLIHYHEALMLLRDLESEITIRDLSPKGGPGDTDMIWVGGGLDSAIFCCLRSEMLKLFRNAVRMLPKRERLVMTLCYCENLSEMEIRLTLDIPESTFTRLSASAHLHLRARLFGSFRSDHYSFDGIQPADAKRRCSNSQSRPEANVYMSASQEGWLPIGTPWEHLGPGATYDHFARTWLLLDEECGLTIVQRKERYNIQLNEYRWGRDS
jgi:Sigma-70 region 3